MNLMSSRRPEGYLIGHWLAQRPTSVSSLLDAASRYADATRRIHAHFNAPWAYQLRVVRHRGDTLVIYAASAAAILIAKAHHSQLIDVISPLLSGSTPRRLKFDVVPPPRSAR